MKTRLLESELDLTIPSPGGSRAITSRFRVIETLAAKAEPDGPGTMAGVEPSR